MPVKDYYKILRVSPSASAMEIRQSFRKLAKQYHPDKNQGNQLSAIQFTEIREAYEVLIDKKKRQDYHYQQYANKESIFSFTPYSAAELLKQAVALENKLKLTDPFRIDRDALFFEMTGLLTEHSIQLLASEADPTLTQKFTESLLQSCHFLPFSSMQKICLVLLTIHSENPEMDMAIRKFLEQQKIFDWWQRNKLVIALLIAILFCFLIFLSGNKA